MKAPRRVTPQVERSKLTDGTTVFVAWLENEPGLGAEAPTADEAVDQLMRLVAAAHGEGRRRAVLGFPDAADLVEWSTISPTGRSERLARTRRYPGRPSQKEEAGFQDSSSTKPKLTVDA